MGRRIRWLGTPGGALQKCSECDNKTRYWQPEAAVPLCSACAGKYSEEVNHADAKSPQAESCPESEGDG